MRRKPAHRLAPAESHTSRIAWWTAFFATVALVALLNFVRSADAATLTSPSPLAPRIAFEAEPEEDEGEEEEFSEECEEVAEGELECFTVVPEEEAPAECKLTSTDASLSISHGGKLRLTIQYVAPTPTMVAIDANLRGAKGSLRLDGERKRFAAHGSFHETELLSPAQTTRALAARTVMVEIHPLGAPRDCHVYFDQRLTTRHPAGHGSLRLS